MSENFRFVPTSHRVLPVTSASVLLAPILLVCAAALACAPSTPRTSPASTVASAGTVGRASAGSDLRLLEQRIRDRIALDTGMEVGVSLIEIGGANRRVGVNDTVSMHAASTMKVPIMLELFRQAESGRFTVDSPVLLRNTFSSIADGSPYTLGSDRDTGLIDSLGHRVPYRRVVHSMITLSSNLATNIMIEEVRADSVQRTMARIGAEGMRVLRGVSDDVAFSRGMNNTTTAAALARVMEVIERCEITTRDSCDQMFAIMEEQRFRNMIPAGVPAGIRVGNKTGNITAITHDAAIVRPVDRPAYVLVVLTRGYRASAASVAVVRDISSIVWDSMGGSRGQTP